ncbi:DUF302 domain-containing protein [Parvularcula lutaonensis]|uniref:DUF302 domain-containing protein n=1 Tax=Parvularcula lutaonensis TaxID=491923 RepID=A0ABV7MC44_9PROT|nr:DUF302 domain-containing protein [Parvularcula lutaonensis]GGY49884.1 hypothetical protein GCM10007148_18220 [Parvularcula lutaonensis]
MKIGFWAGLLATAMVAACNGAAGDRSPVEERAGASDKRAIAPRFVVTESNFDHDETMRRLYEALDRRDLTVFAVIDHAAGAREAGLELPASTVVIFGSPDIGTPLMQVEPLMAAELPIRAAVFEDSDGKVKVAVTSMNAMLRAYENLSSERQRIDRIRNNLAALSAETTGTDG